MRKVLLPLLLLIGISLQVSAQRSKDIMKEPIPVAMFQVTYGFQIPGLDTRTDFGVSHTIGGSFCYKTESNWLLTANGNYLFGRNVKGDRISIFGEGITTEHGEIIGGEGSVAQFSINQRGFHFQAELGKLFPVGPNPNSGIFVQAGLGYLMNRIRIDFQHEMYNTPYMVNGDYKYGYDRMRGGPAFHLETGYLLLSDNRVTNLAVSLEATYARARHLRDYDFRVFTDPETGEMLPVGRTDPAQRFNFLYYGIRLTWIIPTYQRQPEEFYYN